jgi:hypothetical protein
VAPSQLFKPSSLSEEDELSHVGGVVGNPLQKVSDKKQVSRLLNQRRVSLHVANQLGKKALVKFVNHIVISANLDGKFNVSVDVSLQ